MSARRACFVLAFLLVVTGARAARADRPADSSNFARPANRCQLAGQHVSGVVAVDLGDGQPPAQLTLVDVVAIVAMAPSLADVVVYVTEPIMFTGRFVSRDLGGPAAYVARPYRSPNGGVQLAPGVPFEITLSPSDASMASVRLPSPFGTGALSVTVSCAALRAGAPRVNVRQRPSPARPRLLTLAPGTRVLTEPGIAGTELARVLRDDGTSEPVSFVGRAGTPNNGFVRVSLQVGPARINGYVPEGSVVSQGVGIGPASPAGYVTGSESVSGMQRVRLPVSTPIFANATATRSWASLNAPLDVFLRTRVPGQRSAITLGAGVTGNQSCRYDGVAGRVSCGDARTVPRLSLRSCSGSTCTDVAFVNPP